MLFSVSNATIAFIGATLLALTEGRESCRPREAVLKGIQKSRKPKTSVNKSSSVQLSWLLHCVLHHEPSLIRKSDKDRLKKIQASVNAWEGDEYGDFEKRTFVMKKI